LQVKGSAAAMLGISVQYFLMSHFALMDTALAATVTGALYFYASGSILLYLLFTALAFYAKGFLGVVLVGAVIGVDLLLERNWKKILWLAPLSALVLAAFIAPWIYALWKSGGTTYLKIFFVDNHLHRFASTLDHKHPFYYYLGTFPADFLPWSPLFLAALYQFLRARGWASDHRGVALCVRWFAAIFILLSIATSKRSMYMMPLTPAAALLTAHWVLEKKILSEKILVRAFAVLILLVVAADAALIRRLDADKSFVPFVNVVKDMRGGRELIAYDLSEMESGVFPFYFEQRIPNFKTPEEMQAYLSQNPNKSLVLITNRNKFDLINPVLEKRLKVIHRFRPDQKTRSYLLYSTPS
jgi:4-amino-4-deoxy-L-arabinose transferase-like glycosyltransferase